MNLETFTFTSANGREPCMDAAFASGNVVAIADGISSKPGSERAATAAIEAFDRPKARLLLSQDLMEDVRVGLLETFVESRERVKKAGQHERGIDDIGTTLAAAVFIQATRRGINAVTYAHQGDSRIWLNDSRGVRPATLDHNVLGDHHLSRIRDWGDRFELQRKFDSARTLGEKMVIMKKISPIMSLDQADRALVLKRYLSSRPERNFETTFNTTAVIGDVDVLALSDAANRLPDRLLNTIINDDDALDRCGMRLAEAIAGVSKDNIGIAWMRYRQ